MDFGLLLLHGFIGAAFVAHALQKLLVFRVRGTTAYMESLGFRAPGLMARAVIGAELTGGILLGLGLLLPFGAALIASAMLVAARTDHRGKGWFITGSGAEYVATNAVVVVVLTALGGGRYALDSALRFHDAGTYWAVAVIVASVAGAALVLSMFLVTVKKSPVSAQKFRRGHARSV
jgi:putative oxidoreductase